MIMGKNTHLKAAIADLNREPDPKDEDYEERKKDWVFRPELTIIRNELVGNTGLIFTNGDLSAIKEILDSQVRGAPAKVGALAPKEVIVPPGPTGMDPKQTQFFQALNIQTKIVRAQIEIVNAVTVIMEGDKITQSQAALLDKLKITPFEYKMNVRTFMEKGKIFDAKVLDLKNEDILEFFSAGAQNPSPGNPIRLKTKPATINRKIGASRTRAMMLMTMSIIRFTTTWPGGMMSRRTAISGAPNRLCIRTWPLRMS